MSELCQTLLMLRLTLSADGRTIRNEVELMNARIITPEFSVAFVAGLCIITGKSVVELSSIDKWVFRINIGEFRSVAIV
jgi:hypothetical protein